MGKHSTDEQKLQTIRDFFTKNNRIPKETEFRGGFSNAIRKKFGSWENAVKLAVGQSAKRHYWTDEEIFELLRSLTITNKETMRIRQFPTWEQIRSKKKSLSETIRTRFTSLNAALEIANGQSPRTEILKAIRGLTPPSCPNASTIEIQDVLRKDGIEFTRQMVGVHLDDLRNTGYITGGRTGRTTYWSLTLKGKTFWRDHENLRSK